MNAHTRQARGNSGGQDNGGRVAVTGRKAEVLWAVRRLEREWAAGRRRAGHRRMTTREVARGVDRLEGVPWPGDAAWDAGTDDERAQWATERTTTKAVRVTLVQLEGLGLVCRDDAGRWSVVEEQPAPVQPKPGARKWYVYGGTNRQE